MQTQSPLIMQIEASYPLSPVQHGMLIHSLSAPQSGVYVQQLVSVLREELNVPAFRQAWDLMVNRHAILRTSFVWDGADEPLQRVHRDVSLPFECHDWSHWPAERREELLKDFLNSDRERGFRFDEAPLMRQTLFRYAEAEYRWIWTSHHALLDGRSRLLLLKELFAAYEEILGGRPTNLNGAQSYRNYIDWLNKNDFAVAEGFWRDLLSGFTASTPLPPERNRPAENSTRTFGKQTLRLSVQVTRRLQSLAREHQLTPNTFLEGAWALLLSLYSGETDVVFGVTRAGRHAPVSSAESMVGLLINTVPVRVSVPSEKLLLSWLRELRDQRIAMRDFEHTPLVKIRQWSEVPAGKPLFESLLVFENYQLNSLMREQGADWEKRDFNLLGSTHYPLSMAGYLGRDLVLEITYDHHRFDDAAIARMLGQAKVLLEGMVSDPARRLADLPRMTQEERLQLLVEWNDTKKDYPQDLCLHELFERQVERRPDAVAMVFEDQQLTYRELNRRANQLAHRLRRLGVGPEVLVGICLERSLEMIVALLGTLKAGGAYVPLHPTYPEERLGFILQDIQASVLLTQQSLIKNLPEHRAHVICLDRDWAAIAQENERNPAASAASDNLAYLMYTSGSTGEPKGVGVAQRGVVRLVMETNYAELSDQEVFLQFAPLSFDASTFEIWACLLHGGRLVIFPPHTPSLEELGRVIQQSRITTLWLTSALFQLMVENHCDSLGGVKQLLAGGDILPVSQAKKALANLPECRLINGYGPTENTTFSCCYSMAAPEQVGHSVAIGRPIANTQVYLLDQQLNPVPIGASGELYAAGDGLARGYLNRPELTAEKFIPHPFSTEPGARLYKTGDLARYLPDGNIEFLGRSDNQVKLRGYRIEPGEIEAALSRHGAVRQSLVVAREDSSGEKRLVAYVATPEPALLTGGELRAFLQQKLPDYMIPSTFVILESLPLTANGKVDRKALPAPDLSRPEFDDTFSAPRTPTEELLADIWTEVLKIDKVGIHDNFFELGGHSLLATQVISRVQESSKVELPLRSLFESPTVAGLAERIEETRRGKMGLQAPPILATPRDGDLPLSFAQQRLWFLDQMEPNTSVYNIPSARRLKGPLDVGALAQSLNEIVRRHEALRTTVSIIEGQPVQRISPSLSLPLPVVALGDQPESDREADIRRLTNEEAQRPFDLSHGPLVRATLLRLNDEEHVLLLTMHHIASDGWSMGVLFRELSALYEAISNGRPSPLESLPVQYADFAQWQREWLQGEVLEAQLGYWRKQLENVQTLQLPTDRPRPAVQSYRGARQSIVLSRELTEALKTLSRRQGVTLFMTLLAAFQTLLYRYTGQEDIVVGSPIAGRNRRQIEGLIGFFVNTLVLRSDLSGNPSFFELLGRVRESSLEAYAHQDLPFEKLVEELQPERSLSNSPLFQVMFVLQNAPREALEFTDLTMSSVKVDTTKAKFDLTLSMEEKEAGLRGSLQYSTDLFNEETITRMLGHFEVLLESIVANPEQRLSDLPILTEAESRRILIDWNDTKRDYPKDKCIHELFEAQVERSPDAVAVVFDDKRLSYRDLNRRANQLAHYLRKHGVSPEVLVGICVERSLEMIVGLLGILKAGGAYVPLDPDYPKERLAFMLQDTLAPVLLTQQGVVERLPEHGARVLCLDTGWQAIGRELEQNLVSGVIADNLAYVIYTSGSTGEPKGVMVEHRSLVNYLCWFNDCPLGEKTPNLPAITKPTFDASLKQLFPPLLRGDQVWIASDAVANQPIKLFQTNSCRDGFSLNCVPSLWSTVIDAIGSNSTLVLPEALSSLLLGGEAPGRQLLERTFAIFSGLDVWNLYGPTEVTVNATVARLSPDGPITIGRPIANTRIYLLDGHLSPVPIGVAGEIHIGGHGLARGYLNRPELTAEKFIADPFSDHPGARLYRTGDLARYLPDGTIEFLGRTDHQVKIRGFRIEPGEIEAVLAQYPAVRETVVLARDEVENPKSETCTELSRSIQNPKLAGPSTGLRTGKRLVAYVVSKQKPPPTAQELRNFLGQKLPEFMIPSSFMFLEALPLLPHGKVDRSAFPAPDRSRTELEETFVAPRTLVERVLARIWAEVLQLDRISIHDSFFDLGGHSLKAMQLVSKISAAMNIDVSVKLLFAHPTVASFAEAIGDLDASSQRSRGARLEPVDGAVPDAHPAFSGPPDSVFMTIERRPLLSLFAAGKIAPVDAAAIGYLPDGLPEQTGLTREEIIQDWYEQLPTLTNILETFLGRIAIIGLPVFAGELYRSQDGLVRLLIESLELSSKLGARMVSLTGLIPSATNYGQALGAAMADRKDLPKITTGHANTAATVVLTIERILKEAERDLAEERVGFLGLGSIGVTTLRLMLGCLPHPREIILCDIYDRRDLLVKIREEIASALGFHGLVRVVPSEQSVPTEFYDATLIVGATNVPEVIDIEAVRPGTIVVDDSGPHCFSVGRLVKRLQKHEDILITEGGTLQSPHPMHRLRYLPRFVEKRTNSQYVKTVFAHNPFHITGCVLSGLLSSRFQELAPTIGLVEDSSCLQHYKLLCQLGFQAAELHCRDFVLPEESIRNFRRRFAAVKGAVLP